MDLKETYNKIARDWFNDHHQDIWWVGGTEKFVSILPTNAQILDVGCGAGVKMRYLKEKGLQAQGIDFSEEMISIAKEEDPTGVYTVKDILHPLDMEQKFDGVFAQAVLLHVPKLDSAYSSKNSVTTTRKVEILDRERASVIYSICVWQKVCKKKSVRK